jgi:hypothetical protein
MAVTIKEQCRYWYAGRGGPAIVFVGYMKAQHSGVIATYTVWEKLAGQFDLIKLVRYGHSAARRYALQLYSTRFFYRPILTHIGLYWRPVV